MTQQTAPNVDLTWLLTDLVTRVDAARHAVVLSGDGLLIASSPRMDRDDAEHLSAVACGIQSMAKGVGKRFAGGPIQQTIIQLESAFLFITAAGHNACLAVLADHDADVGVIAYEMAALVDRAGRFLASPSRAPAPDDEAAP